MSNEQTAPTQAGQRLESRGERDGNRQRIARLLSTGYYWKRSQLEEEWRINAEQARGLRQAFAPKAPRAVNLPSTRTQREATGAAVPAAEAINPGSMQSTNQRAALLVRIGAAKSAFDLVVQLRIPETYAVNLFARYSQPRDQRRAVRANLHQGIQA